MGLQDDTNSGSQILNFHENNSTTTPQVTMEGRIIFIPRRNRVFCQPGEQVDRRGKCRMVWWINNLINKKQINHVSLKYHNVTNKFLISFYIH